VLAGVLGLTYFGLISGCTTGYDRPMAQRGQESAAVPAQSPPDGKAVTPDGIRLASPSEEQVPHQQPPGTPSLERSATTPEGKDWDMEEATSQLSGRDIPQSDPSKPSGSDSREHSREVPRPYPLPSRSLSGEQSAAPVRQQVPPRLERPSGTPSGFPVQLSAGVALPQTLPTGTAMGFSVDYRWVSGEPDPRVRYFWVIESAGAPPIRQPVQLERQGTLQGFALELRPEHGPFQTYLSDPRGQAISAKVPLR